MKSGSGLTAGALVCAVAVPAVAQVNVSVFPNPGTSYRFASYIAEDWVPRNYGYDFQGRRNTSGSGPAPTEAVIPGSSLEYIPGFITETGNDIQLSSVQFTGAQIRDLAGPAIFDPAIGFYRDFYAVARLTLSGQALESDKFAIDYGFTMNHSGGIIPGGGLDEVRILASEVYIGTDRRPGTTDDTFDDQHIFSTDPNTFFADSGTEYRASEAIIDVDAATSRATPIGGSVNFDASMDPAGIQGSNPTDPPTASVFIAYKIRWVSLLDSDTAQFDWDIEFRHLTVPTPGGATAIVAAAGLVGLSRRRR